MDSLASNPGGSGIYGQQPPSNGQDALNLVFQLRDRESRDFKDKANFMADLSLKQDRMRALFDPNKEQDKTQMNTVMAHDPNQMTGYEKAKIGIDQQGIGVDKAKLAQQGKLGQEALDIKDAQQQLNQQESDQINAGKQVDMQRKIDESTKKFELAQSELDRKTKAGEDTLQAHKDLAAAVEERHKLEREMTQHKMDTQEEQFKALRDEHEKLRKQNSETKTTVEQGGEKRVTTIKKGEQKRIGVIGPNGESGTIEENDILPPGWKKKS